MIESIIGAPRIGLPEFTKHIGGQETSGVASFAGHLADVIRAGEDAAVAGIQSGVPTQQVVEKVMQAERTLNMAISVRDKVVAAYLEMTRMQI